jgi:hypothetical protein
LTGHQYILSVSELRLKKRVTVFEQQFNDLFAASQKYGLIRAAAMGGGEQGHDSTLFVNFIKKLPCTNPVSQYARVGAISIV